MRRKNAFWPAADIFATLLIFFPLLAATGARAEATSYYQEVKAIIVEVHPAPSMKLIDKFLAGLPKSASKAPLEEQARLLARYLFQTWALEPDTSYLARAQKDNVLPDNVLANKRGHCLGLTTLYLLAGEKLGVPIFLVRGPDHVFPRLCDRTLSKCLNVETLKKGAIVDDSYYVTNLTIPKQALDSHLYLESLKDPKELSASLYLGLGFITAHARQLEVAELLYTKATLKSPSFAEPYSNLAATESQLGKPEEIEPLLRKAIALNPTQYAALLNLGVLAHKKGNLEEALQFYTRALESNPLSVDAFRKRAKLYLTQDNPKAALLDLERILVIQPRFCDVLAERNELAEKLGKPVEKEGVELLHQLQASHSCLSLSI